MGVSGQRHEPSALPPAKRPCTHCTEEFMGPPGRSGRVYKTSSSGGFDPWTVQHAVSRYTKCATPTHIYSIHIDNKLDHIDILGGLGSSVGIATYYGLDGRGSNPSGDEIFRPHKLPATTNIEHSILSKFLTFLLRLYNPIV